MNTQPIEDATTDRFQLQLETAANAYKQSSAQLLVALQFDLAAFACLMSNDRECVLDTSKHVPKRAFPHIRKARADLEIMERVAVQFDENAPSPHRGSFASMTIMHTCLQDRYVQQRGRDSGTRPPVLVRGARLSTFMCK